MAFRKKVSFLGFITGAIVDIVASNIWGVVITIYVLISYRPIVSSSTEMTQRVMQIFKTDPVIFVANLLVGGLFSILGGYIAALIAKHDELLNGALSSFLCVSFGIYSIITGVYSSPVIVTLLSLLISPLLGMVGGYFRLMQRSRVTQTLSTINDTQREASMTISEVSPRQLKRRLYKAITIGQLVVNVPVLMIMFAGIFLGYIYSPGNWWWFAICGFILAWLWWAYTIPRWRKWAIQKKCVPADKLHNAAVATGLEWPKGWIFEKTEIKVKE